MSISLNSVSAEHGNSKRLIVALLFVSIGFQALAFAVPGDTFSLIFRLIGVLPLVVAISLGMKSKAENKPLLTVGIGVVTCLTAIALVATQTYAAQAAGSDNYSSIRSETITYKEPDLNAIANTNKSLVELKGVDLEEQVLSAKELKYSPKSGATPMWSAAQAYTLDSKKIVAVPLESELSLANKILFIWENGKLVTQEVYGEMLSDNKVQVRLWNDGKLSANKTVVNLDTGSKGGIEPLGMNWGKLNQCLNSIGINWAVLAVISVACGWACALTAGAGCIYCLSAATGWTGGSISGCVYRAWE